MRTRSLPNTQPDATVLTGKIENGTIHFHTDRYADVDNCPMSEMTITPFGTNAVIAEWKDCQEGKLLFAEGGAMKEMSDNLDLLTLKEVAELLHCSKAHISKAVSGKLGPAIPSVRLGRRKLIRRAALLAWIESNENGRINTPERGR
jgi:excisionase family DNA binding protein